MLKFVFEAANSVANNPNLHTPKLCFNLFCCMKTNESRQFRPVKSPSPRRLLNELLPRLQKDLDQGKDLDCGLAQQHGQMTTHHLRFCRSPQAMKQWEIIMKSSMNHTSRYVSSQKTGNILCVFFLMPFYTFLPGVLRCESC